MSWIPKLGTTNPRPQKTAARTGLNVPTLWRTKTLAACLGCLCLFPSQGMAQSLVQLLEQTRQHDPQWQAAQAQYSAAQHRAAQAQAGLLPSLGLQAGVQHQHTNNSRPALDLHASTQTLGIVANQPLYRPANRIQLEQAEQAVGLAQAQQDGAAQDLIWRLAQAYFGVLSAQDSLTLIQAQKAAVQEQHQAAQRHFTLGNATITDAREAQARLDLIAAQEIGAQNQLEVQKLALAQLTGHAQPQPWTLGTATPLPTLQPSTMQAWLEQAEQAHPALRQARIAQEVAKAETRKANTGHKPTVDFQLGYTVQHTPKGTPTLPGVHSSARVASAGVVLNMPLFAGFSVQNRVRETLSLEDKTQAERDQAERSVTQAVRSAFLGVQSGLAQIAALEAAQTSSELALAANQRGYEVGVRVNIDVLNAQAQLYQTRHNWMQARYQVLLGMLQLKLAAGTLGDTDIAELDRLLTAPGGNP